MNLNAFKLLLAQAAAAPQTADNPTGAIVKQLLFFALLAVVMWLLLFQPQRKRAKEHAALMATLKPGDKIVTSSGIIGVVIAVKEKSISIRSADTKLEILKSAVSEVTERSGESSQS
jgi:preprotein translocase subunit YajC